MKICWKFETGRRASICAAVLVPLMMRADVVAQGTPGRSARVGDPLPGLTREQSERFLKGKAAFEAEETEEEGIGPVFNARSCVACHAGPATGGGSSTIFGTRFGRWSDGGYDDLQELGGPTIQSQGIGMVNGVNFVGEVVPPEANVVARRRATPTFGFGLVDNVPDSTFVRLATLQRRTNPATAGRPNLVVNFRTGLTSVGRFGWKAEVATVYDFAADAYKDELGVTTAGFTTPDRPNEALPFARSRDGRSVSEENPPQGDESLLEANPADSPNEADDTTLKELADFMTMLAPPARGTITAAAIRGEAVFARIGCTDCHLPNLRTGASLIRALNQVVFKPYSDFLLHEMGELGDGIGGDGISGSSKGSEMRTAPLWGLRFQEVYLHDGRAATLEAAILWHDGQGRIARSNYARLPAASKRDLEAFLKSL